MGIVATGHAERLLAALLAVYDEARVELPTRRYLAPGPMTAWDDEHAAVYLTSTLPGSSDRANTPGGHPARGAGAQSTPRGAYEARVVRCIPTLDDDGAAPPADAITSSARELLRDVGLLLDAVYRFAGEAPLGSVATPGQAQPLGPDGGLAGWSVTVTVGPLM